MKNFYFIILSVLVSGSNPTYSQCFTKISTTYSSNHALKSDGTLWNWGEGGFGQFGNNILFDNYEPTETTLSGQYLFFNAGRINTFVIKSDGTLWGTGGNFNGALGINSTDEYSGIFNQISATTNWRQVSASTTFTLATKTDNTLWGWGQNNSYQMGDGTCCNDRLAPGQIGTATDWKLAIACTSTDVGLALKTDGTLWGWGGNGSGLVGESNVSSRAFPTLLSPDTNWETLAVGAAHALALKTDGTLWAWGVGFNGQTGDNLSPLYFRSTPRQIGTDTWIYIACGFQQSFAIKSDGTLWAWGRNDAGQLGDGTTIERRLPVQIGTDNDWVAVAAGYQHGVALKSNGALYTWGTNDFGQLGNGSTTPQPLPTYIPIAGCSLGIDDVKQNAILLHPNPAKDEVMVEYSGLTGNHQLEFYDLTGRLLFEKTIGDHTGIIEIATINYPSGVYVVVLRNAQGIQNQHKLVIE
ncbi:MAG TPA: T9SS type A sorting domain-containing protein [Flavobacterium lutivivi]|nr:T9SS type A sorting domain-containing protein [Flavobacterium lutivivi]